MALTARAQERVLATVQPTLASRRSDPAHGRSSPSRRRVRYFQPWTRLGELIDLASDDTGLLLDLDNLPRRISRPRRAAKGRRRTPPNMSIQRQ